MAKISPGVGPRLAQVVVFFSATGDLVRCKPSIRPARRGAA